TNETLSHRLGVKVESVEQYRYRVKLLVSSKNSTLIHSNQFRRKGSLFASMLSKVCPECFGTDFITDRETGEKICTSCGCVVDQVMEKSKDLPFGETYALTSNIAFGKSLGGTLSKKGVFIVLAKVPAETKDLPIRSTQIQVLSSAVDPLVVKRMLSNGSRMMKELGLDRDDDRCHVLSDQYGRALRVFATFLQDSKIKVQSHCIARALLFDLLSQLYHEKAEEASALFPFQPRHLTFVRQFRQMVRQVEEKEKPAKMVKHG
ncbi:MAG: TFIIB-type zinc ribbon-containing protein, partial [Candidatus Bathyarchaeota archaeon]